MQVELQQFDGINIGCHDIHIRGHLNVDIDPANNPQLCCSALDVEKYVTHQVHHIYCGHLLEHLTHEEGAAFLQSCKRLLAPHGLLTVVVPDWKKATASDLNIVEIEMIVLADRQHRRLFDAIILRNDLIAAGFPEVHEVQTKDLVYCRFPEVFWQTAAIAINHPPVDFHGIDGWT